MRTILGTFLAFNGGLWWVGWLLLVFLFGMSAAVTGSLSGQPLAWQVLALPVLTLVLAIGDAMVVFGLTLIGAGKLHLLGRQRTTVPERNPLGWFLLRSLRSAGAVLALIFSCQLLVTVVAALSDASRAHAHAWMPALVPALLNFLAVYASGRLLPRFEEKETDLPW